MNHFPAQVQTVKTLPVLITLALFSAGIAMGIGGALIWAWGVRSGQFRDLERTKEQLFWPDIAPEPEGSTAGSRARALGPGGTSPGREGTRPADGQGDTSRREG